MIPGLSNIVLQGTELTSFVTSLPALLLSYNLLKLSFKIDLYLFALAGVAQCIECRPVNQRVTGSIPSQGTCLGCWPGPR